MIWTMRRLMDNSIKLVFKTGELSVRNFDWAIDCSKTNYLYTKKEK